MSEWRLPKLVKDDNIIIQSKYAISNIDNIAGILTCLSVEARGNELVSMAFVLTELADELLNSTAKIDSLQRWAERQKKA
jgi:hypothetical protein